MIPLRRVRSERGSAAIELLGMLPLLLLAALAAWQLLMVAFVMTTAENAARVASRAASLGRPGEASARASVRGWLHEDVSAAVDGTRVVVSIRVPLVFPGLPSPVVVSRSAELPATGDDR